MKYLSIDLETTGLDALNHQILSFSGILEDSRNKLRFEDCPKFNIYILRQTITGSAFAISMNSKIISLISRYGTLRTEEEKKGLCDSAHGIFLSPNAVPYYLYIWTLVHHEQKDYGFLLDPACWIDKKMTDVSIRQISEIRQTVDPVTVNVAGKNFATFDKKFIDQIENFYHFIRIRQRVLDPAVLFIDWKDDLSAPDLAVCKERAQISGIVTHDSLYDAWDVIELFRKFY
jgi:oligoribonuclease